MAFNKSPLSFFRSGYAATTTEIQLKLADATTGEAVDGPSLHFSTVASTNTVHIATGSATPSKIKVNDRVYVTAAQGGLAITTSYWVVYSFWLGTTLGHDLRLSTERGGAPVVVTDSGVGANPLLLLGPLNEVTYNMARTDGGNGGSADWRQIVAGIMEGLYQKWANLETADRPTKLSISKSSGVSGSASVLTYTVRVTLQSQSVDDLAPE